MGKIKLLVISILVFVFSSCMREIMPGGEGEDTGEPVTTYVVSIDKARAEVESMLDAIDPGTRNGPKRKIASSYTVGGFGETKSDDGEVESPLYYIFNFEDGEGFALASGDIRTPPVFCITEQGSLSPDELPDNPGLVVMLSIYDTDYRLVTGLPILNDNGEWEVVTQGIGEPNPPDGPIDKKPVDPGSPVVTYSYGPWADYATTGTRIPVKWGQRTPYNDFAPSVGTDQCLAGCGAVASAIVMAHWQKPESYDGYTFDWREMRRHISTDSRFGVDYPSAYNDIGMLHYYLNLSKNLNADYGVDGTGVNRDNYARTFKNFGYASGGTIEDYNYNAIKACVSEGRPATLHGYAIKNQTVWLGIVWDTWYTRGHAWVVDQIITQRREVKKYLNYTLSITYYETREMLHCNWGWNGLDNGLFFPGRFDANNVVVPDGTRGTETYGTARYYQYKVQMNSKIRWR